MRALVTGVNGFVGPWLVAQLRKSGPDTTVAGWYFGSEGARSPVPGSAPEDRREVDLRNASSVDEALARALPDVVYHLASVSSVAAAWHDPALAFEVNLLGTVHLLAAIRRHAPDAVVVIPTSGEVYGPNPPGTPHTEQAALAPISPYAVSKAAQDLLAAQEHAAGGLTVVRLRPFNHTGPRRPDRFAEASFARQIAEIEAGRRPPRLEVGNLEAVRDLSDVRDVVLAYQLAADARFGGRVFNICSGRGIAMSDVLAALLDRTDQVIEVVRDPARDRPSDIASLVGDPTAAQRELGWSARIELSRTFDDLLAWWRQRVHQP